MRVDPVGLFVICWVTFILGWMVNDAVTEIVRSRRARKRDG